VLVLFVTVGYNWLSLVSRDFTYMFVVGFQVLKNVI